MSGPWDRPSPDREPLASDQDATPERPEAGTPSGETWPSSDLWSDQRPGAGSGWDDWSTLRAPDDFVLDEPVSTLGDPWSESWAADDAAAREDAAGRDEPSAPAPDRWAEAPPDRWDTPVPDRPADPDAAPWGEPSAEPEELPSASAPEPVAWSPVAPPAIEPEEAPSQPSAWDAEPPVDPWGAAATLEPATDAPRTAASSDEPRVAAWQPSDDPWAAVAEPDEAAAAEAPSADEGGTDALTADEVAGASAEPVQLPVEAPEPGPREAPEPASTSGGWRRDLLPSWLAGRTAGTVEPTDDARAATDATAEIAGTDTAPDTGADTADTAEIGTDTDAGSMELEAIAPDADAPTADAGIQEIASDAGEPDESAATIVDDVAAPDGEDQAGAPAWTAAPAADAFASEIGIGPTAESVGQVSWEADALDAVVPASLPEDVAGDETDVEAVAEIEAAPASTVAAWPEADAVDDPAATAATETEPRPEVGEAADDAPDSALDGASAELESAPAGAYDVAPEGPDAPLPDLSAEAPAATAEEAWVAEPEAWEPVAWTPAADPVAPVGPDAGDESARVEEPWAPAAAAGAAAGMVAGASPDAVEREDASAEPTAGAEPTESAGAADAGGPQPTWRPDWLPDLEEIEAEEHTRVLPTDWTPPPVTTAPVERSELAPHATTARTRPAAEADRDLEGDAEPDASTAEQAVPWLIGFILLLAGMVIVLLALIFAGDASLGGGAGEPTPQPSLAAGVAGSPSPTPIPSASVAESPSAPAASASASPAATDAAIGGPAYGPIEMVYQGRAAALAPIYLLHREFTTEPEPEVLAQDPNLDLRRYAWAMDGTRGAGMYADLLVSVEPGVEKRQLADGISAVTFGSTPETVYAVRVTQEGADDVATVLAIDFASGAATELARLTYARPAPESRSAVTQAQYEDEGGQVRLFWMEDNQLRLWVLNGGMWEIDPGDGAATELARRPPLLWSPDGRQRIVVADDGATSTLTRVDMDGNERASVTLEGLVSHVRWSPDSKRIVFTLGRSAPSGGVLQDLFLWDLGEEPPTQITATGAAFGAEWMGSRVRWREDPG